MKLVTVHVKNYRSILNSNPVEIGDTTCLVGKNEAGKTVFLKALEGLRSVDPHYHSYDKTECYPRRYLADYGDRHSGKDAVVVESTWKLDKKDKDRLIERFGEPAVTGDEVKISKGYGSSGAMWDVPLDHSAVLQHLSERFKLPEAEYAPIRDVKRTDKAAKKLDAIEKPTESQSQVLGEIHAYRDSDASLAAVDILEQSTPKFLYFSHYDRMSGEISIEQLKQDKESQGVRAGDQVFLDFLEYAGTTLEDLAENNTFEDMIAKCEAAANRITDRILEYWTQNDHLAIDIRLDAGKPEDKAPFNTGTIARARVKNNLHRVTVPFSDRSAGFIWFFSFLVKFAQIKKKHGNVIILLDEPGLTLHGTAQKELLRYFEEKLEPRHQLIYSTHSPFMVKANNLASVRTVEDVIRQNERGQKNPEGTKVCSDVLTTDPQTNFPLLGAMGFAVTEGLIIAPNTLLVEGPSDILYLQVFSNKLKSSGRTFLDTKWAICPSGGIDKILPFVSLFYGNKMNTVVLTDFERGQKRKLEALHKAELLEKERIILATEIAEQDEADIEDFFEPALFVELVNKTYALTNDHKLTVRKIDKADTNTTRLVKKAEAYFRLLPEPIPIFNHFDPARHLLLNPNLLNSNDAGVEKTLNKFEEAFKRINKYS